MREPGGAGPSPAGPGRAIVTPRRSSTGALRWGVLAPTARIARLAVLPALIASDSASVVAVASASTGETPGRSECGIGPGPRWYRSYETVLDDDEVEAVYVPLPNSLHRPLVEAALAAGKHVLCEKPLATTAADAQAMAAAAQRAGRVLLEAYMTPHHPRTEAIAVAARSPELGEPRFAHAGFTFRMDRPDDHRMDPAMGGGALLDVGIYCLAPLLAFAGTEPDRVAATAVGGPEPAGTEANADQPTGTAGGTAADGSIGATVDISFAGLLSFPGGPTASFECSFDAAGRQILELVGSKGALYCEQAFTPGPDDTTYLWRDAAGRVEQRRSGGGRLYQLMVEHFAEVVAGRAEPVHPLSATLAVARTIDRLRASLVTPRPPERTQV